MLNEDKPIEKVYYTIGEVATMFNLTVSNVRFWETEFDILMPKKNARGDRFFTKKDIENLRLIHYLLKERGYTISGAKKKLKEGKNEIQDRLDILKSLEKIKSFLVEMKKELDRKPIAEELNVVEETSNDFVAEDVTQEPVAELSREVTNESDREITSDIREVPLIDEINAEIGEAPVINENANEINAEVKEEKLHPNSLPPISPDLFSSVPKSEEQIRTGHMPGDEYVD